MREIVAFNISKIKKIAENGDNFQRHKDILSAEAVRKLTRCIPTMIGHVAAIEGGAVCCNVCLFRFCARMSIDVRLDQVLQNGNTSDVVHVRGKSAKKRRTSRIVFNASIL